MGGTPCQPKLDSVLEAQLAWCNTDMLCRAKHQSAHKVVGVVTVSGD